MLKATGGFNFIFVELLINKFEDNVTNVLIEKGMSSEAAKLVANGVSTLTLTAVGASTGLSTGILV